MTLGSWDPFKDVAALQDRINRLFQDAFPQVDQREEDQTLCAWRPAVDIFETPAALVFKAELAGVNKTDVSVEIKDNVLVIKGHRPDETDAPDKKYFRRERCFGAFQRSFNLQYFVNPDTIQAKFKDGLLEVTIPKPSEEKPRQIEVHIA